MVSKKVEASASVESTPSGPVERDEYTAKQIATRLGVDAKVLRKFFRSPESTVKPVGQGGRYVFDAADLPKIREEFEKYNSTKKPRGRQATGASQATKSKGRAAPASATVIEEDDELLDLDDLEELDDEPTEDDLEELDDEPDINELEEFEDEELDEEDD